METEKILYPFANVMGIFFPVGKIENGGSCEFATEKCLKKCCANHKGDGKIGFEKKKATYEQFMNYNSDYLIKKIMSELLTAKCSILSWFASGDCPSFLESDFHHIVRELDDYGIIQTGFTRNESLWNMCKDFKKGKILLTVENFIENKRYDSGLYSIPNYEIGAIDIVYIKTNNQFHDTGCGGGYYTSHILTTEKIPSHLKLDCRECYKNKTGCFTKFKTKK